MLAYTGAEVVLGRGLARRPRDDLCRFHDRILAQRLDCRLYFVNPRSMIGMDQSVHCSLDDPEPAGERHVARLLFMHRLIQGELLDVPPDIIFENEYAQQVVRGAPARGVGKWADALDCVAFLPGQEL